MKTRQLLPLLILLLAHLHIAHAQLIGGEAFLQGNFVEAGISACGSFGTNNAPPAGYHPNAPGGGLGYVADLGQDGWATGAPPFMGDYFLPGSPVEGFGLEFGGNTYLNGNDGTICSSTDIPGSVISYNATATEACATWEGTVAGVTLTIETCVPANELYFISTVTICNNSGSDLFDVYFLRHVDPDNEQTNSGSFTTENEIIFQPDSNECRALVGATGQDFGAFLGLGTINPAARVAFGGFGLGAITSIADVHAGVGVHQGVGSNVADDAIDLTLLTDTLLDAQCNTFSFAYILDSADIDEALNAVADLQVLANGVNIAPVYEFPFCPFNPDTIELEVLGGSDWTWSTNSGIFIDGIDTGHVVQILTPGPTTVTATGVDQICGLTSRDILLFPDSQVLANAGPPVTVQCDGDSVQLLGSGFSDFQWSPTTGLSDPNIPQPMLSLNTGGGQWYTLSTSCGTDSTFVDVVPTFSTSITPSEDTICLGGSSTLNLTTSPSSVPIGSYDWSPGDDLSDSTIASPLAIPTSTGDNTYFVEAVSDSGCIQTDSVTIHVAGTAPTVFITPDQTGLVCPGTPLTLTAQASQLCPVVFNMFDSFGDGWNGAQMDFVQNGTVVASSTIPPGGSAATDTVELFSGVPVDLVYTTGTFEGEVSYSLEETDGTVLFAAGPFPPTANPVFTFTPSCGAGSSFDYTWSPAGLFDSVNDSVAVLSPTTPTTVFVDADNGTCSGTGQIDLQVEVPRFEATPDDTSVCLGDIVQLGVNQTLPLGTCEYTLDMDDTFGDGWNGAELEVFVGGTSIGFFSAAGNGSVETFPVTGGSTVELVYTSGAFEAENSYTLFDEDGTAIFSDGHTPATGPVFTTTAGCTPSLTSSTVCNNVLDLNMFDSFEDGWNGASLNILINGTSIGTFSATGSGSSAVINAAVGDVIELVYSPGAWEGEVTYELVDTSGNVLFSDGPNPSTGSVFTTTLGCTTTPPDVTFQWSPAGLVLPFDTIPDPITSPSLPTDYIVSYTYGSNGCTFEDTVTVNLGDFPYTLNDTVICALGDSVELNLTGNPDVVNWTPDPTLSALNIPNPVAVPDTDPKVYYVNFTKNGCAVNDSVVVTSFGADVVDAQPDLIDLCIGGDTLLSVEPGFADYEWQLPDGSTSTGTTYLADEAGFYYYTLTQFGCDTRSDSIEVRTFQATIDAQPDSVVVCAGDAAILDAEPGFSNYQWRLPDGSIVSADSLTTFDEGFYFYTLVDDEGCIVRSDSIEVIHDDSLSFQDNVRDAICCTGDSIVIDDLRDLVTGNPVGLTAVLNGTAVAVPIVIDTEGAYTIDLTDENGCATQGSFDVARLCLDPVIDTTGIGAVFTDDAVSVSVDHTAAPAGGEMYTWSAVNGSYDNNGVQAPIYSPDSAGNALLSVSVSAPIADGAVTCVEDTSLLLLIGENPPAPMLPAAFTPNNDGLNDTFGPTTSGGITVTQFRIYNRWGELVFDGDGSIPWDGTTNGVVQPAGTYVYRLEVELPDGSTIGYAGSLSLIL